MDYGDTEHEERGSDWSTASSLLVLRWLHYPQDYRNPISVALAGNYNQVNTVAQGYDPIAAAYKPSMTIVYLLAKQGFVNFRSIL